MQIPFLHQQLILETERMRDMHRAMMMHNSAIPSVEMEAFLQQIRKIYGVALQLGSENALQLMNEVHLAHAQVISQALQTETGTKAEVAPVKSEPEPKAEVKPESKPESKPQPVQSPVAQQQSQPVAQNGQTVGKKYTEHSTVADKIAGNDSGRRLSDNLKMPVTDINAAIGINEKFQFINQLFQGDSNKYTQFIQQINKCQSADAARKTISEIADANHWENTPSAKQFIDVIERKFA